MGHREVSLSIPRGHPLRLRRLLLRSNLLRKLQPPTLLKAPPPLTSLWSMLPPIFARVNSLAHRLSRTTPPLSPTLAPPPSPPTSICPISLKNITNSPMSLVKANQTHSPNTARTISRSTLKKELNLHWELCTPSLRSSCKLFAFSSTRTLLLGLSVLLDLLMELLFSSSRRKMEVYDSASTIADLTRLPSKIVILFLSSPTSTVPDAHVFI